MTTDVFTVIPKGAEESGEDEIKNSDFFPNLSVKNFRDSLRVDETVPFGRVKATLINAILKVNADLSELSLSNLPYTALADVPSATIAGTSTKVWRYKSAVFNEAKADLIERYRDFDSTQSGHDEADKLETVINDYRQKAREHIRALLGKPPVRIALL